MSRCTSIAAVLSNNGHGWRWRRNGLALGEQPARSQNPQQRFAQQGNTVRSLPSFYCARQWNIHLMCLVECLPFALSGQRWSYSGVAGACSFWRRTCAFWRSQRRSLHLRGNPFRRHHPITCRQISSWFVTSVRVPIQPACPSAFFCLPVSVYVHPI